MDDLYDSGLEESGVGSWGPSGRKGNGLEPEEAEAWRKEAKRWSMDSKGVHANKTPPERHKGLVYDQFHSLTYDPDGWRSYAG